MANYIKPKEFLNEILISKKQDKLTDNASNMIIMLAERTIKKMSYKNDMDREDCLQTGIMIMLQNWRCFDENITTNAFAYFTEVFKRGMTKGYNDLEIGASPKKKGDPDGNIHLISLDSCNSGDGMYNL